jgi:hypothetical protein
MVLRTRIIGSLAAAALLLTGCGQAAETIIESQTGADVEVSDGGETVTFSDEETGTTVQGGTGTQLPAAFPSDIPEPPGGQLFAAAETPEGLSVMWTVEGLTTESFDAYVASVKSAGYDSELYANEMDMGEGNFTKGVALTGNGQTVSITGVLADGTGQISMVIAAE